jgi:hypothetical protein
MFLANRCLNDALADICPWSVFLFDTVFSIDVFSPPAQVVRLLNWFADGWFGGGFVDVGVASVVIW